MLAWCRRKDTCAIEMGVYRGDLSLGEWLKTSRSSWMMETWMLRPSLHVQSILKAMPAAA